MVSVFAGTSLPVWSIILLVAIAALVVLVTFVLLLRCFIVRKRAVHTPLDDEDRLTNPAFPPFRQLTVRRGRAVSLTRNPSLTGSRFGLGQFLSGHEDKQSESRHQRTRSPFGIWVASLYDRPYSRESRTSTAQEHREKQDYGRRSRSPFTMLQGPSHLREQSMESSSGESTEKRRMTPTRGSRSPFWPVAFHERPNLRKSQRSDARKDRRLVAEDPSALWSLPAPQPACCAPQSHKGSTSSTCSLPFHHQCDGIGTRRSTGKIARTANGRLAATKHYSKFFESPLSGLQAFPCPTVVSPLHIKVSAQSTTNDI